MVRLKDIALRAGVSMMTVSKSLRDERDVSAATKTRIKLLAQQMGYVPNSMAQGLRSQVTKLFGLVIPTITNPVYARIVLALEERAHELGYDILLAHTHGNIEREEACIRSLLARRVAGLFISPVYRLPTEARAYQEILSRKVPTVILGPLAPFCDQFTNVEGDDLIGSYRLTQHLLELGHRNIAFFGGPSAAPWSHERYEGYRRALHDAKLEVDDRLNFQAGTTIEDGAKAALQLMNESSNATAVYGVTDLVAIGCAEALVAQGVRIPQDMSIVGYGNFLLAEHYRVPLTTVRQPKFALGQAAMDAMARLMRGESVQTKRLPVELSIRASTAKPPATPILAQTGTRAAKSAT